MAVCGPRSLLPNAIDEFGVEVFDRIEEAIEWADALNVLRLQLERMHGGYIPRCASTTACSASRASGWSARRATFSSAPGPMNRGVEIDSDVADGPQQVILEQVTNGVAVRMAVLYLLAGGEPELAEAAKGGEASDEPGSCFSGGRVVDPSQRIDARRATCSSSMARSWRRRRAAIAAPRRRGDRRCAGLVVAPGLHRRARAPARAGARGQVRRSPAARARRRRAASPPWCAMPNTDPPTDNQAAVGFIIAPGARAPARARLPDRRISVGQKGEQLAEFGEMVDAGAVAVTDDGGRWSSARLMRTALEYAQTFDIPVADTGRSRRSSRGGVDERGDRQRPGSGSREFPTRPRR